MSCGLSDDHICAICQDPLRDMMEHTSLECGHIYHTCCISTYCGELAQSLHTIECPLCKRTALQMRAASQAAFPTQADSAADAEAESAADATVDLEVPNAQPHPSALESDLEMLSPTVVWNGPSSPDATQPPPAAPSSPDATQPQQDAPEAPTVEPSLPASDAPPSPAASDALELSTAASAAPPTPAASDAPTVASSYPASDVPLDRRPPYAQFDVFCGTCGSNVQISKARCRSKLRQRWECSKCEVKLSQLRRAFGSWPVEGFTKMTREDQQAFFRDCKDMGAEDMLRNATERMHIREDTQEQYYQNGGKCLPLAVWEKKGYDPELIKSRSAPDDIREHPVLGTTYRLKIVELGDRGEKRTVSRQSLTTESKEKRQKNIRGRQSCRWCWCWC